MKILTLITLSMALVFTGCSSDKKDKKVASSAAAGAPAHPVADAAQVQQQIASWSSQHKEIIQGLITKYGQPNERTSDSLIWHNNGPWAKTVVKRDSMNKPLIQSASVNVPAEKMGDVSLFNKNLVVDGSKNLVTSSANREDLNFLAINLTDEIVKGAMSPMEARRQYGQLADAHNRSGYLNTLKNDQGSATPSTLEAQEAEESTVP